MRVFKKKQRILVLFKAESSIWHIDRIGGSDSIGVLASCLLVIRYILHIIQQNIMDDLVMLLERERERERESVYFTLLLSQHAVWVWLTTVGIAPGRWLRKTFTTWKMSTTFSILQHSMALKTPQKIPDRVTLSLQRRAQEGIEGRGGN